MIQVLLVEDEEMTMNLLKIIVNWEEFHMKLIGCASNGRDALFFIREKKPDLIVTDIKMPIMDGLKLAEEVHLNYPDIKVMLVTAYDDIRLAQQALRNGVVDFILKPLKRQEMKEALERICVKIKQEQPDNEAPALIEQIKAYLEEHYAEETLSLSDTAEKFYLNPSYLSRTFRKKTGVNFIDYLNEIRIRHACDYLAEDEWKIYEIASMVGIPNPDYFSRCFRKKMGISVKDYRTGKKSTENSKNS